LRSHRAPVSARQGKEDLPTQLRSFGSFDAVAAAHILFHRSLHEQAQGIDAVDCIIPCEKARYCDLERGVSAGDKLVFGLCSSQFFLLALVNGDARGNRFKVSADHRADLKVALACCRSCLCQVDHVVENFAILFEAIRAVCEHHFGPPLSGQRMAL
jgi:hypothetical protein